MWDLVKASLEMMVFKERLYRSQKFKRVVKKQNGNNVVHLM